MQWSNVVCMYVCVYVGYVFGTSDCHCVISEPIATLIVSCRPATSLDTLQKKQKEIEEENQKKKALLHQVLAERYHTCLQ